MQLEVQVALNFIISYLYNKLPRRRVTVFGEELGQSLKARYKGHWYPERPSKGSGFRCIHVGDKVDPVVERAAKESGLDVQDVREHLPQDLSVWVDPWEVSYQIGDKGPVQVLYVGHTTDTGPELDMETKTSFNPEAQVFMPLGDPAAPSSVSSPPPPPVGGSAPPSPRPLTFTTATFAATKFGSTKMKTGSRSSTSTGTTISSTSTKGGRRSPTPLLVLNGSSVLKHKASSSSVPPQLGVSQQQLRVSSLSPNAKEFVFPPPQAQSGPGGARPAEGLLDLGHLTHNQTLDLLAACGGLRDGLDFRGRSLQHSAQQGQPVMAN